MYKLIACDLDETLLNSDKEISERNVLAIKRAQQEFGIRFVPATGRGYTCIQNVLDTLDVHDKEDEYIISGNGSIICENKDFKKLTFHTLPFKKAKQLFTYGIEHGLCIQVFTDKDVYAYQINEDEKEWLFMFKSDAVVMEENTIDFLEDTPIMKILFQRPDMEYLRGIAKDMLPITEGVSISFSSDRYLEMNRAGVDKGLGLRELAQHLGIPVEQTIAIGDNFNDIAMLKTAGLSVAVANAAQEIKDICDYVTTADHNEGGVAEVIEKFIFERECCL